MGGCASQRRHPGGRSLSELLRWARTVLLRVLLPATDRVVVLQAVLAVALFAWLGWRVRTRPEWRLVVVGCGLLVLGWFGLRAAH